MAAPATPRTRLPHRAPALLLLLTALATARDCHHLRPRHDTFLADSLQLLRAMDPSPPPTCPQQQHAFRFPDTLLHNSHPQQAAAATTLRILQHLFSTLNSSSTPRHWDAHAQHQLLNNLHHHISSLEQCLTDSATRLTKQGPRNLLLSINKYFADIQDFLHTHDHSACAWDLVRLEARACFQRLHNLTRTTHN